MSDGQYSWREEKAREGAKAFAQVMDSPAAKAALEWCFPGARVVEALISAERPYPKGPFHVRLVLDHPRYAIAIEGCDGTVRGAVMNTIRIDGSPFCGQPPPDDDIIPF